MAFLQDGRQGNHIGHSSDCLPLRSVQVLLQPFLLLPFLVQVGPCLRSHIAVFSFDSAFAGHLLFLRLISFEVLGSHLLLKVFDLSELFLLVPQFLEQQVFERALRIGDIDLSLREGALLAGVFCSVFLRLGSALHILINLSQNFKNC